MSKRIWLSVLASLIACMCLMTACSGTERNGAGTDAASISETEAPIPSPTEPAPSQEPEYSGETLVFSGNYLAEENKKVLYDSPVIIRDDHTCLMEGKEYEWTAKSETAITLWNGENKAGTIQAARYSDNRQVTEIYSNETRKYYDINLIPQDFSGTFAYAGASEEGPERIEFMPGWKMEYEGNIYRCFAPGGYNMSLINFYKENGELAFQIDAERAVNNLIEKRVIGLMTFNAGYQLVGIYADQETYDIIELTPENYETYFELKTPEKKVEALKDEFGDITQCKYYFDYFAPKDEDAVYHYVAKMKWKSDHIKLVLDPETGDVSVKERKETANEVGSGEATQVGTWYRYPYIYSTPNGSNFISCNIYTFYEENGEHVFVAEDYHSMTVERSKGHNKVTKKK